MEIPKDAKKVFQGVMFDIYHWQQKMFDGSYTTYEMARRKNTVEVIPVVDGKILIGKQEQPTKSLCFSLFGGRQEGEEEPLETAKRELLEETGLQSKHWELFWNFKFSDKVNWDMYIYIAKDCQKIADQNLDSGEKITLKKVTFEEFLDIVENEDFWGSQFRDFLFRLRQNPKKLAEFKNKLF